MGLATIRLQRTSDLTVNNADVVVPFDTVRNTGPSSWWDSNTPTDIVMPWTGMYLCTLHFSWSMVALAGKRYAGRILKTPGATAYDVSNTLLSHSHAPSLTTECVAYTNVSGILPATEGDTWSAWVWTNTNAGLRNWWGQVVQATVSFTYLDA